MIHIILPGRHSVTPCLDVERWCLGQLLGDDRSVWISLRYTPSSDRPQNQSILAQMIESVGVVEGQLTDLSIHLVIESHGIGRYMPTWVDSLYHL